MPLNIPDPRIRSFFDYLSRINQRAYRSLYLIANPVLSKHPWRGRFFKAFMAGAHPPAIRLAWVMKKIVRYYLLNLFFFFLFLAKRLAFGLSGQKWRTTGHEAAPPVMIGVYFVLSRILTLGQYQDSYFPGLYKVLENHGRPYVFCPCFDGESPLDLYRALRILKKQGVPALTEYQVLQFVDYLRLLVFVFAYPLSLIRFIRTLDQSGNDRLLAWALWEDADEVLVHVYARYLYGRRLADLPAGRIRFISWYENQVVDKLLFRGLRHRKDKIRIYGVQSFIRSPSEIYTIPDEGEASFGVVPDVILVNGPAYLPEYSSLSYRVGPSFRYLPLFELANETMQPINILVLLPYFDTEIRTVLGALKGSEFKHPVVLKFHPSTRRERYADLMPGNAKVSTDSLYELLKQAKIVIGSATGALLEAAAAGIPVILIENPGGFTHQFLPELGQGIIWDRADGPLSLMDSARRLIETAAADPSRLKQMAEQYTADFFHEPTENRIIRAFDLCDG